MAPEISPPAVLAFPGIARDNIDINVSNSSDGTDPKFDVDFAGTHVAVISDVERRTFRLTDGNLKDAVASYFGSRPDDAYLRSPTPWGDLYQRYGWNQVQRTLRPRSAKTLAVTSKPQIIMHQVFENNSSNEATFDVSIKEDVQNTASSTWTKDGELTIDQEINYTFFGMGGKNNISYKCAWGENVEKSESVTIGHSSGVEIVLQPGQAVISQLHVNRGTMKVEIEYEASLSGRTALNYSKPFQGHHFWSLEVEPVMYSGGLSNSSISREVIDVGFYSDSKIVVMDRDTKAIIVNKAI